MTLHNDIPPIIRTKYFEQCLVIYFQKVRQIEGRLHST